MLGIKQCTKCIMDETDPSIVFDEGGVCNHCKKWFKVWNSKIDRRPLARVIGQIRGRRTGKYDAIIGISGGIDSSYVAYLAFRWDIKALLVHADDGWNTPAASGNVRKIVTQTGWDFEHVKFDSVEFHDIVRAYLKSGVVGLESPTDNALRAVIYDVAKKNGIKTIMSGGNWVTEGIMPGLSWGSDNNDAKNIKSIHKKHGTMKLKNTRLIGIIGRSINLGFRGFKEFRILNHLALKYNRADALKLLERKWNLINYGRKHNENRFTKFVECYIFPERYGFDKRLAHYSTLICSGQMTRDEALELLKHPLYTDEEYIREREFFIEQLGISQAWFEEYMTSPIGNHSDYASHKWEKKLVRLAMRVLRRRM